MSGASRCILAGLLLLFLSGCESFDMRRAVPATAMSAIKSVGVVSALGDKANFTLIGTTVFNNEDQQYSAGDWGIDAAAVDAAVEYLSRTGRYTAKSLHSGSGMDVEAALQAGSEANVDAVVRVVPSGYDGEPNYPAGYGLYRRSILGQFRECAYALFVVEVHEVRTRRKLAWEWGFRPWTGVPCYGDKAGSWTPSAKWRAPGEFSNGELRAIAANVVAILDDNVPLSLEHLGFGKRP